MDFFVFGLNHTTAPVEVRERWAFSPDESRDALQAISARVEASEHLILSTCNRTEFYGHVPRSTSPLAGAEDPVAQRNALVRYFGTARRGGTAVPGDDPSHFYLHCHDDAVRHLFRLAGGLGSMIVGESEILRQIKLAYGVAREARSTGRMFHRLFPEALRVGKRVRTLTGISDGCITPGQAALRLATGALGDLSGCKALLIGSGKIATLTARAILDEGVARYTIVNRTKAKADALLAELASNDGTAADSRGSVRDWASLREAIVDSSLVISSTGASQPIVDRATIEAVQIQRGHAPLALVDLAIPRDIAPQVAEVEGVHLFNIDDLNAVIQDNIAERHSHVPKAEEIVSRQSQAFAGRMAYKAEVDPVIRHLMERFEDMRLGHLQAVIDRFPPELHEDVDQMTRSLVKKLLHFPIERLKSLRDMQGLEKAQTSFLRRLFLAGDGEQ